MEERTIARCEMRPPSYTIPKPDENSPSLLSVTGTAAVWNLIKGRVSQRCRLSRNRQRSTTISHTTSFFCPMWLVCPSPHERRYSVSFIESAGRHLSHLYLARPGEISFPDFMPATRYLSFERTQEFLSHEIRKT